MARPRKTESTSSTKSKSVALAPSPANMKDVSFAEAVNKYQVILSNLTDKKNALVRIIAEMRALMRSNGVDFSAGYEMDAFEDMESNGDLNVYKKVTVTDEQKVEHNNKRAVGSQWGYVARQNRDYVKKHLSKQAIAWLDSCVAYYDSCVSLDGRLEDEKATAVQVKTWRDLMGRYNELQEGIKAEEEGLSNWKKYVEFCKDIASIADLTKAQLPQ